MFWKKRFKKTMKKMDVWDIALVKLAMIVFTLAALTTFGRLLTLLNNVNPFWYWGLFLLFAARPMLKWIRK